MSINLNSKQKLFIKRMTENQEQASWGFEILLKRQDFADFFDHLAEAKLFAPENNSGPVPAEDPGFVRIPYWNALDYLEAVANLAGENNDLPLANKVLGVVRSVSIYRDSDNNILDNYHTYRKFAQILGLVPTVSITPKDLELIPIWLNSKYDRGLIGQALSKGVLHQLLSSDSAEDWQKACTILHYCTAIKWVEKKGSGNKRKDPLTVVKDYWLKRLINKHAKKFGTEIGREASQILRSRVREIFDEDFADLPSYISRPAVEDHPQNHSWNGAVNCTVEGLRDILLFWVDTEPEVATFFVAEILEDENEMIRRIGVYVLKVKWPILESLYKNILHPSLFSSRNIHELYHLLRERFGEFSDAYKKETLETIRKLQQPSSHENPERMLRRIQRNWLSAIINKNYEPADEWYKELEADESLGPLSGHPDFHSYMESSRGPGPSPYSAHELLAYAEKGKLIEQLNNFEQTNEWRGPSIEALVNSLEETVSINPQFSLELLPTFLDAKRPYQYGVINGFKQLWDTPKDKQPQPDWNLAWPSIIDFFEKLLNDTNFWNEEVVQGQGLRPTRDWIPPLIADFLRNGTRDDNKAYSQELLPRGLALIKLLLENSKAIDDPKDDTMFLALNSSKGKAIEALFSYALRACRVSDKEHGDHVNAWEILATTFDSELEKCKDSNYEFSTLAGNYLANIEYLSSEWLQANLDKVFPQDFQVNFLCAIDGLAYAAANRKIYMLLVEHGILDKALTLELKGRQARERIVERIALAYLWGDETLDSPRFSYLFDSGQVKDLEWASNFFTSVRRQELTKTQIEQVLCFWEKCVAWAQSLEETPGSLLSELSRLACYVNTIGAREASLLAAVSQYVEVKYNADMFIEELDRLVDQDPTTISNVLGKVLDAYKPDFDYQDRLKNLLIKLADHGKKEDVLLYAERIRRLPGINQLFKELTKCGQSKSQVNISP